MFLLQLDLRQLFDGYLSSISLDGGYKVVVFDIDLFGYDCKTLDLICRNMASPHFCPISSWDGICANQSSRMSEEQGNRSSSTTSHRGPIWWVRSLLAHMHERDSSWRLPLGCERLPKANRFDPQEIRSCRFTGTCRALTIFFGGLAGFWQRVSKSKSVVKGNIN